jgi:Carboxypeptidase regulatory-like domain
MQKLAVLAEEAYAHFMTSRRWVMAAILGGATLTIGSVRADTSIQGLVLNSEGKPVAGAEVRADKADNSSARRLVTKTDAGGRYAFNNLPVGPYTITVVGQNGARSNPRTAYSTDNNQPIRRFMSPVPYQLRPDFGTRVAANDAKVTKRYVWKPGETGSHIGGQWINAADASRPSTNPLQITNDLSSTPSLRVSSMRCN